MGKQAEVAVFPADGTYGFFARELAQERKGYFAIVIKPVVLVLLLMWVSLPVYWGALFDSAQLTDNFDAWFVNRDGARIGNTLWQTFSNTTAPGQHLGWQLVDPAAAGNDDDIVNAVIGERAWVVVVIEANATMNLARARMNGDANYDPRDAITVYYAQARQETAVGTYVLPITTRLLTASATAYATASAQRYFAQITPGDTVNQTAVQLLAQAPQTISPGVSWNMVNLRPYTTPAALAVTLVGNIFLTIFAFVMTMAHAAARAIIAPRLRLSSYLVLRVAVPFMTYLPLSLSYTLVNVAFDMPFDAKYSSAGGFFVMFAFVYLGMLALGLSLEAMITLLTPKFVPYFLFILIIYNISPTLLPQELLSPFFAYGVGFPVWNLSQAVRTILFNTASHLGRNAGVMLGWVALSCGTTVLFTWWMHRREVAALLADQTTSLDRQTSRSREHAAHVEEKP